MANPIAGQPNFLDLLRERVASSLQDENLRRLSDLGAGMLSSNSPNFFTMLGAGVRAQETGEASRMEQLRRAVEAERQEQARQDEVNRRQEEARIQAQRYEQERPLREAQTEESRARARLLGQQTDNPERFSGRGRTSPSPTVTPALRLRAETQAANEARQRFPDPPAGMPDSEAARSTRLANRDQYIQTRLPALLASLQSPSEAPGTAPLPTTTPAPAVPVIEVNPLGRPTR